MIAVELYLLLGAALFALGLLGAVTRRTAVAAPVATLLMLNGAAVTMVAAARAYGRADGTVAAVFVALIAAAEIAVGLAIVRELAPRDRAADLDASADAER